MRHIPTAAAFCLVALGGCPRGSVSPAPDALSTAPRPLRSRELPPRDEGRGGDVASAPEPSAPRDSGAAVDPITLELTLAWPEDPLPAPLADSLLVRLGARSDPLTLPAAFFAAARRLPPTHLPRLFELTPPASRELVARGLSGRAVSPASSPTSLPPGWFTTPPSLAVATVAGRFGISPTSPVDLATMLTSGDPDVVIAGARLIPVLTVPLPPIALLSSLSPYALTVIARPLAARARGAPANTPRAYWTTLVGFLAPRAHDAPRTWGNAWRALRDALPVKSDSSLGASLAAAVATVMTPSGLPDEVTVRWNCENAAAADKILGLPALTLRCARDPHHPYALAAQAEVLGSAATQPALRSDSLSALFELGRGSPVVLAAVATATAELPGPNVRALLRRLAAERDPGVLASLIEGINKHPELARELLAPSRLALLRAPFALPEGPSLEARVQSLKLARTLHIELTSLVDGRASQVRAILAAMSPDTVVSPRPVVRSSEAVVSVRFDTDAGPFVLDLDPSRCPAGVSRILNAVRSHRYDGLTMHRVVPGFVAQGGDPRGDGYGGTDELTPTELSLSPFARGSVGIPLAGLDTGGIQFFVTLSDVPHLDGRYPFAGSVRRGMEVIDSMLPGDALRRVEVLPP